MPIIFDTNILSTWHTSEKKLRFTLLTIWHTWAVTLGWHLGGIWHGGIFGRDFYRRGCTGEMSWGFVLG